jgi:hypothetical protein
MAGLAVGANVDRGIGARAVPVSVPFVANVSWNEVDGPHVPLRTDTC